MPRFCPRFSVRRLMVVVAIVALVLCGWETWRKRSFYLGRAGEQASLKDHYRLMLEHVEFLAERHFADKSEVARSRRLVDGSSAKCVGRFSVSRHRGRSFPSGRLQAGSCDTP